MENKFRMLLATDIDYEDFIIYIFRENDMIAILDQEKGPKSKEIEIKESYYKQNWKIPFKEFKSLLDRAENFLDYG